MLGFDAAGYDHEKEHDKKYHVDHGCDLKPESFVGRKESIFFYGVSKIISKRRLWMCGGGRGRR